MDEVGINHLTVERDPSRFFYPPFYRTDESFRRALSASRITLSLRLEKSRKKLLNLSEN